MHYDSYHVAFYMSRFLLKRYMEPAKILHIDSDSEFRQRIANTINHSRNMQVIAGTGTLHSARTILGRRNPENFPELALIDPDLPDGSALSLINWLNTHGKTRIIVLTAQNDRNQVVSAIKAGAGGYLLKSETMQALILKIENVLEGTPCLSSMIVPHLFEELRPRVACPQNNNAKTESNRTLTPTELEVLQLAAKGYNSPEIAKLTKRASSTVHVHIRNIYKKLSVHSRTEAIFEATNMGLIFNK